MQEYELNNILEQYDLTINSTRKARGAILEILGAARYLARTHLILRGYKSEGILQSPSISDEYTRHNCELRKVRKYLRSCRQRSGRGKKKSGSSRRSFLFIRRAL